MGILAATGGASVLLFSLAAGLIVDRVRRRPVMILSDCGRAILLGSIPLLAVLHRLGMAHLIAVAAAAGVLTVLFDVAYQSYLPALVQPDELLEGNRLLSMSSATAEILGPSLTGVLVQLITAPIAVLLDALSFVVSAVSVWAISVPEKIAARIPQVSFRDETLAGFRTIWQQPALRALLLRSITAFLSAGAVFTFYVLYAIRVLHFSPAALGVTIALGGVGSLLGGMMAGKVSARFGVTLSFFVSALVIAGAQFLMPLASVWPRLAIPFLSTQQLVGDFAWTIYFVNEATLRQSVTPPHLLGRVNAAMQLASRGMLPIGALASGFLGERIGITNMLWIGTTGVLLSTLWLVPLLRSRTPVVQ